MTPRLDILSQVIYEMEVEDYSTYEAMTARRENEIKVVVEAFLDKEAENRRLMEEIERLKKRLTSVEKELSEAYELLLEREEEGK